MSMYRLSKGCFVFLLVMLAWTAIRYGMIATGFDHSSLGCGFRDFPGLACQSTLLEYLLNAPLYVFLVLPFMALHLFKSFSHPNIALIAVLGIVDLAVLILGLFVYPWLRYFSWRAWW